MTNTALVVFDIAGTTVRDENHVSYAFQQAMKNHDYHIELADVSPMMGYRKPEAIAMMLDIHEPDKAIINEKLIADIHEHFLANMIKFYKESKNIEPLPNAEYVFGELRKRGIKVALDTGFSRAITEVIVNRLAWADKVDAIVCSDEVENGRPFPDMINTIKRQLNISDSAIIAKIGDTEVDINEGKNAECKYVIGITTGSFSRSALKKYQPTHIIDDLKDVLDIIA